MRRDGLASGGEAHSVTPTHPGNRKKEGGGGGYSLVGSSGGGESGPAHFTPAPPPSCHETCSIGSTVRRGCALG